MSDQQLTTINPKPPAAMMRARLPKPVQRTDISDQAWMVLTNVVFPAAKTPEVIALGWDYCQVRKLDIFKRPINIVPQWNSQLGREVEGIWPSIMESQVTAARAGTYAGLDPPKWGENITQEFTGR